MGTSSTRLSKDQEEELKALEELSDDQIDTADIPEILDWSDAKRGVFCGPMKYRNLAVTTE